MANTLARPTKRTYGFTMVELLIVIVVVAILAAIVVVAYNSVQTQAKSSAIIAGLKIKIPPFSCFFGYGYV